MPLDAAKWDANVAGQLRYRGGLQLTSPDKRFGGYSGLMVSPDGATFTAVSDGGTWARGALAYDADGNLSGVADVVIEPIRETDGRPFKGERGDAEALSPTPEGGAVVAFERDPKLRTYPAAGGKPAVLPPPAGIEKAPPNSGMEALTRLADGRFLVVTEYDEEPGRFVGWIGGPGGWSRVTYSRRPGLQAHRRGDARQRRRGVRGTALSAAQHPGARGGGERAATGGRDRGGGTGAARGIAELRQHGRDRRAARSRTAKR